MTMLPHEGQAVAQSSHAGLERMLRMLSVVTMAMTVPQAVAVWSVAGAAGVSLASWGAYLVSACLWFVYGLKKRDPTIYVACIGWILLDAAIVAGILFN
jgi:uncharacterized protein with PQ loop repeat